MAKNRIISVKTACDIDRRVERVLRGLGHPEPPLRLEDVRELLQLDRGFYTADDPSVMRETISRIRVAGIQICERPMLLIDAIRKSSLKALYLPDRKRILLDAALPRLEQIRLKENQLKFNGLCFWLLCVGERSTVPRKM